MDWGGVSQSTTVEGEEQQQAGAPCWQECKEILTSTHLQGQNINGTGSELGYIPEAHSVSMIHFLQVDPTFRQFHFRKQGHELEIKY